MTRQSPPAQKLLSRSGRPRLYGVGAPAARAEASAQKRGPEPSAGARSLCPLATALLAAAIWTGHQKASMYVKGMPSSHVLLRYLLCMTTNTVLFYCRFLFFLHVANNIGTRGSRSTSIYEKLRK